MFKSHSPMTRSHAVIILGALLSLIILSHPVAAEDAKGWFERGNELRKEGRLEDAAEAYKESIRRNPNAAVVHYNLGRVYKNLRQYEKAASALETSVEMEPQNLDAHLALGNVYNFMERWEEAIGHLNLIVHRRTGDAEAHGNLGWAYYNYKSGPAFKYLVIVNLKKAVDLFDKKNMPQAADATREVLREAMTKYGFENSN
ncbi:MAG: tetratricopeptide repeat protein [Nitrospinales bacterium]